MGGTRILAIDQSTQATKAILFDRRGAVERRVTVAHRQIYPGPGLVEHDPAEIAANVRHAISSVLAESGIGLRDLAALSVTNQRETIVAWDMATGRPVHNALVWQDGRGAALCAELAKRGDDVRRVTGLRLDPFFSASKLAWIVRESPEARAALAAGTLAAGTMDSWLIWNLTGGKVFATDYSNASRTMLFDIRGLRWDEGLIGLFGLGGVRLPEVRCSDAPFGEFDGASIGLAGAVPIAGVMGDSHAALFGHCGWHPGDAKATYGTGSSIMTNIGPAPGKPGEGVVLSLGWGMADRPTYVLEGNIHSTGYTMRWLRDNLGLFSEYAEAERMALEAGDSGGVFVVPAFSGLGAPHWVHGIKAIITGLSHASDRRHIVRAGLESIAFQIADLADAMNACAPSPIASLHVDGGPTRNDFLMQFQADIADLPVAVPEVEELSALGAACMGGLATGFWSGTAELETLDRNTKIHDPAMLPAERAALRSGWNDAVAQALHAKH